MADLELQQRVSAATEEALSHEERVYRAWQDAKALQRQGKAQEDALRPEVEELLADGFLVGDKDAWLGWQERESLTVDLDALVADLGEKIALRVCEVSGAKVKKLVELGLIPADAPYLKKTVAKSLVTRTDSKKQ